MLEPGKLTVNGGGVLMLMMGRSGFRGVAVSHPDCSVLPSKQLLQDRAVNMGQPRSQEAHKSARSSQVSSDMRKIMPGTP